MQGIVTGENARSDAGKTTRRVDDLVVGIDDVSLTNCHNGRWKLGKIGQLPGDGVCVDEIVLTHQLGELSPCCPCRGGPI